MLRAPSVFLPSMPSSESTIVCKFGGSSLAQAAQFRKVREIVMADPKRRIIVPSAPGKRDSQDTKITDLLYVCHKTAKVGADLSSSFALVQARFLEIEQELGIQANMAAELQALKDKLQAGTTRDFAASRGEHLNAKLLAVYLGATFVDPIDHLEIDARGQVSPESYPALAEVLSDPNTRYVMPGFYGKDSEGQVRTFSRGGSDISGSIAARAVGAALYENWTDVSGLLMTDPRIVPDAEPMAEVSYAEIRELSYMGASVLHDEAIAPVRDAGIPIAIKNTNRPQDPGTHIVSELSEATHASTEIAGIAGKRNFCMISVQKNLMNKEVGFGWRLLGVLGRHDISFEHCPSSIDSMSVVCEQQALEHKLEAVLEEIQVTCKPDELVFTPQIALIAVVGEGMARTVGIAAKVFGALKEAGVNVILIDQGASELNIIIGVEPGDYETSVRALYRAFVPA